MMDPLYVSGFDWFCAPFAEASPAGEATKLDISLLAPSLRRGLSDPTRLFMHVAKRALARAQLPAAQMHVVFASAFGEIAAAEKLMAQTFVENNSSPARFRHSVHNTAAGLFSISTQNQLPATAIAAGWDTPAMGLLEASALLSRGGAAHVLLVFAEEPVPAALSAEQTYPALAASFVLSSAPTAQGHGSIEHMRREPGARRVRPEGLAESALDHPLAPCIDLCRALEAPGRVTLTVGEGPDPWCVDVDASGSGAHVRERARAEAEKPA